MRDDLSSELCPPGDLCRYLINSLERTCGPTVCILCDSGENDSTESLIRHSISIYSARPIASARFRKSSSRCRARRTLIFNNLTPIKIDAGKANILMAVKKSSIDSTSPSDFHWRRIPSFPRNYSCGQRIGPMHIQLRDLA